MIMWKQARLGVVVRDDRSGGVYRGHYDVWFGESEQKDGITVPIIRTVLVTDCQQVVFVPLGIPFTV
jgi:hypothetical protein